MRNIVRRTTLIVRDLGHSARWYEEVAGMTRFNDGEVVLSGKGMAAGKKGDRTHLVIMQCVAPRHRHDRPVAVGGPAAAGACRDPHVRHLRQPDGRRRLRRCAQAFGARTHSEPHEWFVTGADGVSRCYVSVSLFGPNGYFYEFNQQLP